MSWQVTRCPALLSEKAAGPTLLPAPYLTISAEELAPRRPSPQAVLAVLPTHGNPYVYPEREAHDSMLKPAAKAATKNGV